ncbi:hypothetical protein [Clostridium sp. OS1-26]|uniref:hypothetical protein n=1 Tax=Clostridium sp. OS1-26 TaxID=3070681 RepID=UPI0027E0AF1F|nr:hypothetical protein [Clostridium sp. OS1-26]WML33213.1 hypothetical protein RCG18_17905 [Clostridium sp. OS1-26]
MNKKIKLLTSTLCGVLLASSLTFANVQAAPAKNIVQTNISNVLAASFVSLSPAVSTDGVLYWTPQKNATTYKFKIYNKTAPYTNQQIGGADNGIYTYSNIRKDIFADNAMAHPNCNYQVEIKALDSSGNTINTATLDFYYTGTTFLTK